MHLRFPCFFGVFVPYPKGEKGVKAIMILQGPLFPLQSLMEQLTYVLITSWGIVILVGTFASALLIAIGFISWLSGIGTRRGKRMIIGGVILFFVMQWLALNPPWLILLG